LHDTPKQRLFQRDTRAFSSGCIRVENAIELAEYLLNFNNEFNSEYSENNENNKNYENEHDNDWNRQKIRAVIDSGKTVTVPLTSEIPLYLVYWTAWVSNDEHVYFRKDVYGWDNQQSQCN
jgi:murein L,D-transpeptidase YcbB/YkuD